MIKTSKEMVPVENERGQKEIGHSAERLNTID